MNDFNTNPATIAAQLTLAWPEVLIQQIADAVAERLSDDDRSSSRSPGSTSPGRPPTSK